MNNIKVLQVNTFIDLCRPVTLSPLHPARARATQFRMNNLLRRGQTWFVRYHVPEARQADVGRAMGARGGMKREVVRTLRTTDRREAHSRRDAAIAVIRAELDVALERAKLRPLSDWTATWPQRAQERRRDRQEGMDVVAFTEYRDDGDNRGRSTSVWQETLDAVSDEADAVAHHQGKAAGDAFTRMVMTDDLSVAEAARMWLEEEGGRVRQQTRNGHKAALALFEGYLAAHVGLATLEGVPLSDITRRIAGEFITFRHTTRTAATVKREASTFNGLWRWASRKGHTADNPWHDQTAGLRGTTHGGAAQAPEKRGYTSAELVTLIRAGNDQLAPGGGGYGPALWDIIRLGLLTGARANELVSLRVCDVVHDGTVIATPKGGKTANAARLIPLHTIAQRVVRDRIASLPDRGPEAPLWPEVPTMGGDARRSKLLCSRFVTARRRVLKDSEGVDLHSLRRSFATAAETAINGGGRLHSDLLALLFGHKRSPLALSLYSDWVRLGRGKIDGAMAGKLATLRDAMDDIVTLGLAPEVIKALEETADDRPAVVRVAPAFRRRVPQAA